METVPESGGSKRGDSKENSSVWTVEFELPVAVQQALTNTLQSSVRAERILLLLSMLPLFRNINAMSFFGGPTADHPGELGTKPCPCQQTRRWGIRRLILLWTWLPGTQDKAARDRSGDHQQYLSR